MTSHWLIDMEVPHVCELDAVHACPRGDESLKSTTAITIAFALVHGALAAKQV
ncbi:MAG: hypothetical protein M0Z46_08645 [Actinomycetota bacterium]|nr:hypothetical protein [Actinomycetota bacterium]